MIYCIVGIQFGVYEAHYKEDKARSRLIELKTVIDDYLWIEEIHIGKEFTLEVWK